MPIANSIVIIIFNSIQVIYQTLEFYIFLIIFKRRDRNSICELSTKRVYSIINYYGIFEWAVSQYSQIFDINIICRLNAMISIQPMLKVNSLRINIVKNYISIPLMTSSKNYNLKVLVT